MRPIRDSATAASKNKRIRKEALREQLSAQGHVQHVVDILDKLSNESIELDSLMVQRFSKVLETKLKIINKYLPDDKDPSDINLNNNITTPESREALEEALRAKGIDPSTIQQQIAH